MRLSLFVAAALFSASLSAHATPVEYVFTGNFTGTLGANSFNNAAGTFAFTGDTSTVVNLGGGFYTNTAGVSTITLASLGTATFLSSTFGAESQPNAGAFYDIGTGFGVDHEFSICHLCFDIAVRSHHRSFHY